MKEIHKKINNLMNVVVSAVSVIIRVHKPKCTSHLSVSAGDFFCGDDAHFEVFFKNSN